MSNGDGRHVNWNEEETFILTFIVQKIRKNLIVQLIEDARRAFMLRSSNHTANMRIKTGLNVWRETL